MQEPDKIERYVSSICEQIRWKKAHGIISEEIENHIIDQKNAFITGGTDEQTAVDRAIAEMGDPVIVGTKLDRTHRPKTEWSMILLTATLLLLGQAINLFLEVPASHLAFVATNQVIQIPSVIVGIGCMVGAYFIDFTIIGKYPKTLYLLFVVTILAVFPFCTEINGARIWLNTPLFNFIRISTFLLLFPVVYTGIVYVMRNRGYSGIIQCGIYCVIAASMFLFAGHSITNVFFCTLICFILLAVSICNGWFGVRRLNGILIITIPAALISVISIIIIPGLRYRMQIIGDLLNPAVNSDAGYTMAVTREILSGAKFFGQGALTARYSNDVLFGYLPQMPINYLLTFSIHRLGWVSLIFVSALLLTLISRGFYLYTRQKSILGKLVSMSIMLTLTMQMLVYILVNLGVFVYSPFCLPFISYGRGAAIINLTLVGILLSVFRSGDFVRDNQAKSREDDNKLLEFTDGKIVIDFGIR